MDHAIDADEEVAQDDPQWPSPATIFLFESGDRRKPGTAWRHQIRSAHFNHDRGAL